MNAAPQKQQSSQPPRERHRVIRHYAGSASAETLMLNLFKAHGKSV